MYRLLYNWFPAYKWPDNIQNVFHLLWRHSKILVVFLSIKSELRYKSGKCPFYLPFLQYVVIPISMSLIASFPFTENQDLHSYQLLFFLKSSSSFICKHICHLVEALSDIVFFYVWQKFVSHSTYSISQRTMRRNIYLNKISLNIYLHSRSEWDSIDQAVSVVVVGVNFFSFLTSLKPLHGFASNFVWMFQGWTPISLNVYCSAGPRLDVSWMTASSKLHALIHSLETNEN